MDRYLVALVGTLTGLVFSAHAQSVWIVDAAGGGDFITIQAAIDAASDGDVLLVKPAAERYPAFLLDGKGLAILGDGGKYEVETGTPATVVRDVPAGSHVVLRGIVPSLLTPLDVDSNEGLVWIEEASTGDPPFGEVEFRVLASEAVVFESCDFRSIAPITLPNSTARISGVGSTLVVHDSIVRWEGNSSSFGTSMGSDGIRLTDSILHLGGSVVHGQRGANSVMGLFCIPAGDGGAGLVVDPASYAEGLDVDLQGGAGGAAGCTSAGDPGPALVGGFLDFEETLRVLRVDSPVRGGEIATIRVTGQPGDFAALLTARRPAVQVLPGFPGALLLEIVPLVTPLGAIPASGELEVELALAPFPPQLSVLEYFFQVLVVDVNGNPFLGSGSAFHAVNQAF